MTPASAGASSAARSRSPVRSTCRPTACRNQSVAVGGVVLERARVGRVGEHPLAERRRRAPQQLAPLVGPAGLEQQPLVRGHRVARPLAEPGVAGDDGRPGDDELVGGERQRGRPSSPAAFARRTISRACARRGRDDVLRRGRRRRRRSSPRRARSAYPPGSSVGAERAGVPEILAVGEAAGGLLAVADARVPLAGGREPRPGHAVGALEDVAAGDRLDRRRPPAANRSPCASRQVHERGQLEPHRTRRRARSRWTTATAGPAVDRGQLALEDHVRRPASASAGCRRASSNDAELPRAGRDRSRRSSHSWTPRRMRRVAEDEHRVEGGEPEHAAAGRRASRRRAGRGSAACAAPRRCPSRSRRARRPPAIRALPPRRDLRRAGGRRASRSISLAKLERDAPRCGDCARMAARARTAAARCRRAARPGGAGVRTSRARLGHRPRGLQRRRARPGTSSRTTTPARAPTAGTRTGSPGSATTARQLCFALAFWNGRDPILKERIFGLTAREGNHGEDAKEYWWYLDSTPTHSWMRWRYMYPQAEFPYERARRGERARAAATDPEYELSTPASSTTAATGRSPPTTPRPRRRTSSSASRVRNAGPDAGDDRRAAHAVVPQHLVVGARSARRPSLRLEAAGDRRRAPRPRRPLALGERRARRRSSARTRRTPQRLWGVAGSTAVPEGRDQRPRRRTARRPSTPS